MLTVILRPVTITLTIPILYLPSCNDPIIASDLALLRH